MKTLEKKTAPELLSWAASCVSRKRKMYVSIIDGPVRLHSDYWSEGSRSQWYVADHIKGTCKRVSGGQNGLFGGADPCNEYVVRPGVMVIDCGVFCGKPATPHLYVHPVDYARAYGQPFGDGTPIDVAMDWLKERQLVA